MASPSMRGRWYRAAATAMAVRHNLDPVLVLAIIEAESMGATPTQGLAYRFEPGYWKRYMEGKVRWKDADPKRVASSYGLMQVMYGTAIDLGFTGEPEDLISPAVGLYWGCLYLRGCLDWAGGNVAKALSAYNGGKGTAKGNGPWPNQAYVTKVTAFHSHFQGVSNA